MGKGGEAGLQLPPPPLQSVPDMPYFPLPTLAPQLHPGHPYTLHMPCVVETPLFLPSLTSHPEAPCAPLSFTHSSFLEDHSDLSDSLSSACVHRSSLGGSGPPMNHIPRQAWAPRGTARAPAPPHLPLSGAHSKTVACACRLGTLPTSTCPFLGVPESQRVS